MELGAVSVDTVALVPGLVLAQGIVDAHGIPRLAGQVQGGFHGSAEQEPIAGAGANGAGGAQRFHHAALGGAVELAPEFARRAQQRLRQKGGIHQRLLAVGEVEVIGRSGVGGGCHCLAGQFSEAGALASFGARGAVVGRGARFEPRRDTGYQPAEGFQVSIEAPIVDVSVGRFDRHGGAQPALAEGGQHRLGQAGRHAQPIGPVGRAGILLRVRRSGAEESAAGGRFQKASAGRMHIP